MLRPEFEGMKYLELLVSVVASREKVGPPWVDSPPGRDAPPEMGAPLESVVPLERSELSQWQRLYDEKVKGRNDHHHAVQPLDWHDLHGYHQILHQYQR